MKIIITVHTYWPDRNGVQYVTQYLAEGLAQNGHEVVVICSTTDKNKIGKQIHNSVVIERVYLACRYSCFTIGKNNVYSMLKEYLKGTDILINCCVQSPINNIILPILQNLNCSKVLYMHGMHDFKINPEEKRNVKYLAWHGFMNVRWKMFYLYHRNDFKKYDLMVDIHESSSSFSFFNKMGVKTKNCIIHNAVEDFDSILTTNNCIEKESYFLCVANYNEGKNQRALIKAFEQIEDTNGYKLVLIGAASDYSSALKKYIEDKKLQNKVLILENINREATKEYIKNCYCAILSSHHEVYPIFLCEAIACNRPYISTNVGCVKDIPGGIIIEDCSQLVSKIKYAISHPIEMQELAAIGYAYAQEELTQKEKIKQFEEKLQELLVKGE